MGIDEVAVGHNDGKQEIGIGGGDQTSQRADVTIVRHGHQCGRQQQHRRVARLQRQQLLPQYHVWAPTVRCEPLEVLIN